MSKKTAPDPKEAYGVVRTTIAPVNYLDWAPVGDNSNGKDYIRGGSLYSLTLKKGEKQVPIRAGDWVTAKYSIRRNSKDIEALAFAKVLGIRIIGGKDNATETSDCIVLLSWAKAIYGEKAANLKPVTGRTVTDPLVHEAETLVAKKIAEEEAAASKEASKAAAGRSSSSIPATTTSDTGNQIQLVSFAAINDKGKGLERTVSAPQPTTSTASVNAKNPPRPSSSTDHTMKTRSGSLRKVAGPLPLRVRTFIPSDELQVVHATTIEARVCGPLRNDVYVTGGTREVGRGNVHLREGYWYESKTGKCIDGGVATEGGQGSHTIDQDGTFA